MLKTARFHRQRGAINGVTLFFIFVVATLAYLVLVFIPPWYKSLNIRGSIREMVSTQRAEQVNTYDLPDQVVAYLRKHNDLHIKPGDVSIDWDERNRDLMIRVLYAPVIKFPFTSKTMQLSFSVAVKQKLK